MIRILLVLGIMLWAGDGNAEKVKKCMTTEDIACGYFLVYIADKDGVISDDSKIKWAIPYSTLPQMADKLNKLDNLVRSIDKRVGDYDCPFKIETMMPISQRVDMMWDATSNIFQRLNQIEERLRKAAHREGDGDADIINTIECEKN